jgi:hypothetical protein
MGKSIMFPQNRLSTTRILSPIIGARKKTVGDTIDFEDGGIGLFDASEGLLYQEWRTETDGTSIKISSPNTSLTTLYTGVDIISISCTFDQNMNPVYSFIEEGQAKLRWYDSSIEDYRTTNLDGSFPKVFLDEKRPILIGSSDVILAYTKNASLYFRLQRDRYEIDYLLATGIGCYGRLKNLGMGKNNRLQFQFSLDDYTETCFNFNPADPFEVSDLVN